MKTTMKISNGKMIDVFDLDELSEMDVGKTYKMIQLYINSKAEIIFGSTDEYHCEILEAYLLKKDISFSLVSLPATKTPGPDKTGPHYLVSGAGRAEIENGELEFFGESIGYKTRPNELFEDMCWRQIANGLELIAANYKTAEDKSAEVRKTQKAEDREIKADDGEIPLLEQKLQLLHMCLVPSGFEDADGIVEILKSESIKYGPEQTLKIGLMAKEYLLLKELGKTGNAFDEKYISKLTQIRDLLLD